MKSASLLGIVAASLGLIIGMQVNRMWSGMKKNAVLSGQMSLATEVINAQGELYDRTGRYAGVSSAIPRDKFLFQDGSSPRMLDEMVYHCDADGRRFIAILGVDGTPVLAQGKQGEEWLGRNAAETK
ncbi:MAG: hypothetical protein H7Y36_01630 [Armatimonadetes bacterium]|nr:hypothetical protein [Akkermansiaceae bacterium]